MSSTRDATELKVTSTISDNAEDNKADIDGKGSVTYTVQLVDDDGDAVAKSGVEIGVAVVQGEATLYPAPADLVTDDDGQATYTTGGPKSTKGSDDADREDTVTFTADVDDDADTDDQTSANTINWDDADAVLTSGEGSAPSYSVMNSKDEVTIRASVTLYDQYGNTIGKGNKVDIDIGAADPAERTVSSRGVASYRTTVDAGTPGTDIDVTYTDISDSDGDSVPGAPSVTASMVTPVRHAPDDSSAPAADLDAVYADDNRFRIAGLLYTYDSDDTFVDGTDNGAVVDMAKFESLIKQTEGGNAANVQVVSYDDDGDSIFRVVTAGT
jgi:hypothetical protein